jgi:hypothetical protein
MTNGFLFHREQKKKNFLLPITLDDDDNNNSVSKVTVQKDLQYYKLGVPCYAAVSLLIFIKNIIKI